MHPSLQIITHRTTVHVGGVNILISLSLCACVNFGSTTSGNSRCFSNKCKQATLEYHTLKYNKRKKELAYAI